MLMNGVEEHGIIIMNDNVKVDYYDRTDLKF